MPTGIEKMAADYRSELDAAEAAEDQASAAGPTPSQDAGQTNEAAVAQPETANSNATEPTANAKGDQGPTTD
jgi:hypothetical protein